MKKQTVTLVLILFAFMVSSIQLQAEGIKKSLMGEWVYEVSDAPYGYEKGSLVFSELDGKTVCVIKLEAGELSVSDLKVESDTITFTAYVDSNAVNVALIMKNEQLTGTVDSPEGPKSLTAVKKKE